MPGTEWVLHKCSSTAQVPPLHGWETGAPRADPHRAGRDGRTLAPSPGPMPTALEDSGPGQAAPSPRPGLRFQTRLLHPQTDERRCPTPPPSPVPPSPGDMWKENVPFSSDKKGRPGLGLQRPAEGVPGRGKYPVFDCDAPLGSERTVSLFLEAEAWRTFWGGGDAEKGVANVRDSQLSRAWHGLCPLSSHHPVGRRAALPPGQGAHRPSDRLRKPRVGSGLSQRHPRPDIS